jgi:hypothetical protein
MMGDAVCQLSCIIAEKIPNQGEQIFSIFHVQTLKVAGTEGTSGKANSCDVESIYDRQFEILWSHT